MGLKLSICIIVEGVETTLQIRDIFSAKNRRYCSTTSDITIEHTVHHHGSNLGCRRSEIIVSNNTTNIRTTCDSGITITIYHTSSNIFLFSIYCYFLTMQISYDTTNISCTTYATAIDTTVIDAGFACSIGNNSTHIRHIFSIANSNIIQYDILDNSTISVCYQWCRKI